MLLMRLIIKYVFMSIKSFLLLVFAVLLFSHYEYFFVPFQRILFIKSCLLKMGVEVD